MTGPGFLTRRHMAINREGGGRWFIARVLLVINRSFSVRFMSDGSESTVRLLHYGFTVMQGGQDWRLVARNSFLLDDAEYRSGTKHSSVSNSKDICFTYCVMKVASKALGNFAQPLTAKPTTSMRH